MSFKPVLSETAIGNKRNREWEGGLHLFKNDALYLFLLIRIDGEVEFVVYLKQHLASDSLCLEAVEDMDHRYLDDISGSALNRTELEAIYSIKTDDGVYIHVRNRGIISSGKDAQGNPTFYFKAAPQFEAPADSKYAWLNNSLFVCAPDFTQQFKGIVLNVWRVK